ncbi:MAG: MBL fold metallo-hydrolase, partial [Oscillospiraceae bacterium]|nr:MBL fold metallo-hydrolase [Oscillospiraceae bacterium]
KKNFKVYIDSPLAIEATKIFSMNKENCFDEEALTYVNSGVDPIVFDGLNVAVTSDESKMINFDKEPKVIISASGMCEAGRIKHHLKHNLWKEENTVMFAGYQAYNTLGRSLLDGAEKVKLFGEEVAVRAEIVRLNGVSGHADLDGLITWAKAFGNTPKMVFVNHGESECAENLANTLKSELSLKTYAPYSGTSFDIMLGEFIDEAKPVLIEKKPKQGENVNTPYARLLAALDRLTKLVKSGEGRSNKDIGRLTDRINDVCDKWE